MKLATLQDGSRDGQLVVVSRNLEQAHYATGIASRLQLVLEDWGFFAPQLQDLSDALNAGRTHHAFAFDPRQCLAPLPRTYHCLQGPEPHGAGDGLLRLAGDALRGACAHLVLADAAQESDFGAGLAVITGDIAQGCTPEQAIDGVRLLMLASTQVLRAPGAPGAPWGGHVAASFGPVAVTPDELGAAWVDGRVHLTVQVDRNGRKFGLCDAAAGMPQGFGELLAQAARTQAMAAGTVLCSGPLRDAHSSIWAKRQTETSEIGQASTPYLQAGDELRIELKGPGAGALCGALDQHVGARALPTQA